MILVVTANRDLWDRNFFHPFRHISTSAASRNVEKAHNGYKDRKIQVRSISSADLVAEHQGQRAIQLVHRRNN